MSTEEEAQQAFREGLRFSDSDELAIAILAFDQAIAFKPGWAEAWYELAYAQAALGKTKQALKSCEKALRLKPDYADAWISHGFLLEELGRYQEAVESFDQALKHKPDDDIASSERIEILSRLEEWVRKRLPAKPILDAYETVAWVEEKLHIFIRQRLQQVFGKDETEWWQKGVPQPIRQKCALRREEDPKRRPIYNQIDLLDLKDIMDKNWRHFEADFQKVTGEFKSKKELLDGLQRLNEIRKSVMHPVRGGLTEEDLAFAHQMQKVVESVTPSG